MISLLRGTPEQKHKIILKKEKGTSQNEVNNYFDRPPRQIIFIKSLQRRKKKKKKKKKAKRR